MKTLLPALLFAASAALAEPGPKLAVLGHFPAEGSLEAKAVKLAEDASALRLGEGAPRLRFVVIDDRGTPEGALEAARRAGADAEVRAVVIFGETSADPAVLELLAAAQLPVVAANSWQTPRSPSAGVTWLSPSQATLAESAAACVRKQYKALQVAVLDNGAPTSVAAARAFSDRFKGLGGKVDLTTSWDGSEVVLTRTAKEMKAHWPQVVFFAGEAGDAARLVLTMKEEKELQAATLIGLPHLFEPAFFDTARLKALRSVALFPSPDYRGLPQMVRQQGWAPSKATLEYRAYLTFVYKKPGRWTAMFFDACQLAFKAMEEAATAGGAERAKVAEALAKTTSYRGIRGLVRFTDKREPLDPRAMVYFALNKVNKKEMQWREKGYGPPF